MPTTLSYIYEHVYIQAKEKEGRQKPLNRRLEAKCSDYKKEQRPNIKTK